MARGRFARTMGHLAAVPVKRARRQEAAQQRQKEHDTRAMVKAEKPAKPAKPTPAAKPGDARKTPMAKASREDTVSWFGSRQERIKMQRGGKTT